MADAAVETLRRLSQLKSMRTNFDTLWDLVHRVVWPDGGEFITRRSPGEKRTRHRFETTAEEALEKFAAAMESYLTSRTTRWHGLTASEPELQNDPRVKEFFERAEDVLFSMRNSPRARFHGQMNVNWKSLGAYGNGCMFVEERPEGGIRYRYTHIGSAWIEVNDEGIVDTCYFEYPLSNKAAVQKWGDQAPERAQKALEAEPFRTHQYLHAVRPNPNQDPERKDAAGMAFEAFDIAVEDRQMIDTGGYHELPYIWSRYTVSPNEIYGRGPGTMRLPEIETLQEMEKVHLRSGHKVADPPLLTVDDGKLGRGDRRIRVNPGAVTMGGLDLRGQPTVVPLQTGARLDITEAMMERKREAIEAAFLVNFFDVLARDRVQMTATEVLERAAEKGQLITPLVGRQQSELLGPMIEREIGIAQRQGFLPPLPEALVEAEGEYEIVYQSQATRMQQTSDVAAFQRLIEVAAPFVEMNPSVLGVIKGEEAVRHFSEVLGIPSDLIRTEQEMRPLHEAQSEARESAAAQEEAQAAAGVVRDIGSAMGGAAA